MARSISTLFQSLLTGLSEMRLLLLLLIAFELGASPGAHAGNQDGLAVIVSERSLVQTISQEEVASAFLGMAAAREQLRDLQPVDSEDPDLREHFYQQLLGRSRNQIRAYWSRMVFTGQGRPPPTMSRDQVQRDLAANPKAIVYVRADEKIPGTRILLRLP